MLRLARQMWNGDETSSNGLAERCCALGDLGVQHVVVIARGRPFTDDEVGSVAGAISSPARAHVAARRPYGAAPRPSGCRYEPASRTQREVVSLLRHPARSGARPSAGSAEVRQPGLVLRSLWLPDLDQPGERLDAYARATGGEQAVQRVPMPIAYGGTDGRRGTKGLADDVALGQR